jgi:hypothetical protein
MRRQPRERSGDCGRGREHHGSKRAMDERPISAISSSRPSSWQTVTSVRSRRSADARELAGKSGRLDGDMPTVTQSTDDIRELVWQTVPRRGRAVVECSLRDCTGTHLDIDRFNYDASLHLKDGRVVPLTDDVESRRLLAFQMILGTRDDLPQQVPLQAGQPALVGCRPHWRSTSPARPTRSFMRGGEPVDR